MIRALIIARSILLVVIIVLWAMGDRSTLIITVMPDTERMCFVCGGQAWDIVNGIGICLRCRSQSDLVVGSRRLNIL